MKPWLQTKQNKPSKDTIVDLLVFMLQECFVVTKEKSEKVNLFPSSPIISASDAAIDTLTLMLM